ncbi:MAG: response regulator transcription factor [bacterium]
MSTIRVILGDDHPVVRKGIAQMVEASPDMTVVAEAEDTNGILEAVARQPADVLVLDLGIPGGGGMEVIRKIKSRLPRILVLSVQPEEMYAVRCIRAGASGFLNKEASPDLILHAIRTVSQGRLSISDHLREDLFDTDADTSPIGRLTVRELEVMRHLVLGKRNRDIARDLGVSEKTISEHKRNLMMKLKIGSVSELVIMARDEGMKFR